MAVGTRGSWWVAAALAAGLAGSAAAAPAAAGGKAPDASAAIRATVDALVEALDAADIDKLSALFAPDATAFFPIAPIYTRLEDKEQIVKVFTAFFESVRAGKPGPQYMHLIPERLKVQRWGDTALVTFHFVGNDQVSRRTLVLRREGDKWLIVHMHGSTSPVRPR